MTIEEEYYANFRQVLSKIDQPLSIREIDDLLSNLFKLTTDAAHKVYPSEIFKPSRDWDEKVGELSREIKFIREEAQVIVNFYKNKYRPKSFSSNELVHCIQGSQPGDGIRYDKDGTKPGHIEICFPIEGYVEKKENENVRNKGYSKTGLINLNEMRFVDDELKKSVSKKFSSTNYPDNTVLIVNFGPTDFFELNSSTSNPVYDGVKAKATEKFSNKIEWMKSHESNFSEVFAMYRWKPHFIVKVKEKQ